MDEAFKALGPYPILQMLFGLAVLGLGVWSILKGLQSKTGGDTADHEAEWRAREQIKNIEENSWKMVAQLERMNELLGRLASVLYNDRIR